MSIKGPIVEEVKHQCQYCSRTFAISSLAKHEPICQRQMHKKSRKVFDSGKQRAMGSDIPLASVRKVQHELTLASTTSTPAQQQPSKKLPKWRQQHEQFQSAIQSAKRVEKAIKNGAPLPPPTLKTFQPPSDYVRCDSCGRSFNENAAERHVPFCREQKMRTSAFQAHLWPSY